MTGDLDELAYLAGRLRMGSFDAREIRRFVDLSTTVAARYRRLERLAGSLLAACNLADLKVADESKTTPAARQLRAALAAARAFWPDGYGNPVEPVRRPPDR